MIASVRCTARVARYNTKYFKGRPRVVPSRPPSGLFSYCYSSTSGRSVGYIEASSPTPSPSLSEPPLRLGPNLSKYGVNLNKQVLEGKIDPVIGRKKEIERTIQVLSRRTKNNPCLIGEPGVGELNLIYRFCCSFLYFVTHLPFLSLIS